MKQIEILVKIDMNYYPYHPSFDRENLQVIEERRTLIHQFIQDRRLDIVSRLINYGADLTWHCYVGSIDTPLHRAVYFNLPEIVERLLAGGAPINILDCAEITPIEIAVEQGNRELVCLLLARKAAVSLHVAAAIGDTETIDRYLRSGGDPNVRLGKGYGCPFYHCVLKLPSHLLGLFFLAFYFSKLARRLRRSIAISILRKLGAF
jgi:hypothetical protein